jgi:hypothetical protein
VSGTFRSASPEANAFAAGFVRAKIAPGEMACADYKFYISVLARGYKLVKI